ncbi:MAG: Amidohydrolase 3 [Gemmatimonadetes bacterium]|nr:Amidohydrolase 3 [Gemmatimonadota bacterium]
MPADQRDLVVLARRIHLLGAAAPVQALLVRDGRVAAAGSEREVRALAGADARVESLGDAVVTPGLTDAHVHLSTWALARRRVDLNAARTVEEGLEAIAAFAARNPGDGWILGLGWDVHRWGRLPTAAELDRVAAGRPAYFESHDIHGGWINGEGLRRCGITRGTADPEGGEIVRDAATGEPAGVLKENAMELARRTLPRPGREEVRGALLDAQRECHRLGLTGVHSVEVDGLAHFSAFREADELRLRVLQAIPVSRLDEAITVGLRSGFGDAWLRIGGTKMFLDGALGSRTAWLREPYVDSADRGMQTLPEDEFRAASERAAAAGIATTVHAIGDAAVQRALDVLSTVPRPASMPHRIEHVQLCPPDLVERMASSGIVASMQPVHLLTDIPSADRHWGRERSRGAYPFAPLLRGGATLAFGSDVPVETCDPRPGLFAAVRRVDRDGEPAGEWWPENGLTAEQALRAYTEGPAVASGEAHRRGRLLPGYDADLVAWTVDPLDCPVDALRTMECALTVVAGEVVHRA